MRNFAWVIAALLATACGRFGYLEREPEVGPDAGLFGSADGSVPAEVMLPSCGGAVAASANYRSIGTAPGPLVTGTATAGADGRTIHFERPLPATVGCGDVLHFESELGFVLGRIGDSRLILQAPLGLEHVGESVELSRAYSSPQDWEDDRQGDLVGAQRVEVGVVYDDGAFDLSSLSRGLQISGSITSADFYVRIAATEGANHGGLAGAGVVWEGRRSNPFGVVIFDDYTQVAGLELRGFASELEAGAAAVKVRASGVELDRLIIHDFKKISAAGVRTSNQIEDGSFELRNSFIYGGHRGILVQGTSAVASIEQVTVYDMTGPGVHVSEGTATIRNTLSVGNGGDDFRLDVWPTAEHNMSSDDTAPGPGSVLGVSADVLFRTIVGSVDLHLADASPATDVGAPGTTTDVDRDARPLGDGWDIGADER
ncbi:MAG: hypothetical protein KJO07_04825 [Deltaproteobacteria bacterium]|nr:hypothetical protein [Deltaproteobacteria bacterium]